MKPLRRLFKLIAVLLLAIPVWGVWRINDGFDRGTRLLQQNQFQKARRELKRYLWFRQGDDQARLTLAECYVRDSELLATESATEAIALLGKIRDDSELAGTARLQEARLRFLILNQPCRAERLLKEILQDDPKSFAANYLMWKILDLTRRYHLAEPYFQGCFVTADESRRADLLREWYFSQFSTFAAASQLDQMMGVVRAGKPSDTIIEHRRLQRFLEAEPECALNHAILADWYHEHGMEHEKWSSFDKAWEKANASTPAYAYVVFFDLLLEAGRFEEAKKVIELWPEPKSGYDYYSREGICFAEIRDTPEFAIVACRKAMRQWPGPVDWQLHHRLAGLLTRVGRLDEAETARTEGKRLESLMEVDYHTELRKVFTEARSIGQYHKMAEFYASIDRELEAKAWEQLSAKAAVSE